MTRRAHDRATWNARYREKPLVWSAGPNQFVVEHTADLAPGRALDVACGEGRNALWLAEQGWSVTGIDFSDVAITKAQASAERQGLEIDYRTADVTDTTPSAIGGLFDLVLVAYLQLPADVLGPVLHRLTPHLSPGGTMLVIGHHIDNLARGYGGPTNPDDLHDPARITAAFSALEVQHADEVPRTVIDSDGTEHTAVDSLVLAHRP